MSLSRLVATLFLLAFVTSVTAQETIDIDHYEIFDGRDVGLPPAAEIDPKYLDDANFQYAYCLARPNMADQLDCGCWAMEYLAYAIENPEAKFGTIRREIENKCYDPSKMASYYVQECSSNRGWQRQYGAQLPAFCDCMGPKMTSGLLERVANGQFGGNTMRTVGQRARKECQTGLN